MSVASIVQGVLTLIKNDEFDAIPDQLQLLQIEHMSDSDIEKLLHCFIKVCTVNDFKQGLVVIFSIFENRYFCKQPLDVVMNALQYDMDEKYQRFVLECFQRPALDWYLDLSNIKADNNSEITQLLVPIFEAILPPLYAHELRLILKTFKEMEDDAYPNPWLESYFNRLKYKVHAAVPEWIHVVDNHKRTNHHCEIPHQCCNHQHEPTEYQCCNHGTTEDQCCNHQHKPTEDQCCNHEREPEDQCGNHEHEPTEDQPTGDNTVMIPAEAVEIILRQLEISDDDGKKVKTEYIRNTVTFQYSMAPATEKMAMLPPSMQKPVEDDVELFRQYGPVNTSYFKHEWDDSICSKYGGCRMLLCNEYNEDNDEYELDDHINCNDWWTGRCDQCSCIIEKKHYAVRIPVLQGGWRGCYCSFSCLVDCVTDNDTACAIAITKVQLDEIGIYDR